MLCSTIHRKVKIMKLLPVLLIASSALSSLSANTTVADESNWEVLSAVGVGYRW